MARAARCTLLAAGILAGCSSVGTRTLPADRFDFTEAVARSWKEQVLLNIVKARYGEVPTLVEVNQIVTGYELKNEVRVNGEFNLYNPGDVFGAGATSSWVDRPTLTYSPLTGQRFTRVVLVPIPTVSILYLVQAGYRADLVFDFLLHSINGHQNPGGPAGDGKDTVFPRIVELLRKIQTAGGLDFRVDPGGDGEKPMTLLVLKGTEIPAVAPEVAELRGLLGITPEVREVRLVSGLLPGRPGEVTLFGYSMLQIMMAVGRGIEIPKDHLERGYAFPPRGVDVPGTEEFRLTIRSGGSPPSDAFASVRHLGTWFWIDQADLPSKRAMAILGLMFRVLETGEGGSAPILSIGTN
jgi:hypothetical protein